jgi:MscS family membrane protein
VFLFVKWILFTGYFYFGIVIINTINKLVFKHIYKSDKYKLQKVEANFFRKIISFIIYTTGILLVLSSIGFNISILLGGLGFIGFAVSFAAKESIANFFGGMMILFNKSFDHGDWIYISDLEEGTVVETHFLTTTIRTFDNALITIPNSRLSVSSIRNWSKRTVGRRIKFDIGLVYDTKPEDIKQIIEEIKKHLVDNDNISKPTKTEYGVIQDKDQNGIKETLLVNLTKFNESSVDISIYCFSTTVDWETWLKVREELMFEIINIVKKNNSDFAYKTIEIKN